MSLTKDKKRSKAKGTAVVPPTTAGAAGPTPAPAAAAGPEAAVMALQREAGNAAVSGALGTPAAAESTTTAPSAADLLVPEHYRHLTLRQLRTLAVADKDAAEALWLRYSALPDEDLNRLANNGDPMAVTVRGQRPKPNDPAARAAIEYRPFSQPGVYEKLKADIDAARAESGIRRSSQSVITPEVEEVAGGVMLSAVTNIPGAERPKTEPGKEDTGRGYVGRSPAAGGKVNLSSAFPPPAPYKLLPHTHGHAEQNFADQLSAALGKVDRELLKGKTVWMLVEQAACSTCAAGLRDPNVAPGVLKKLSLAFPELTFEVKNIDENRTLIVKNGEVLNVVPTTPRDGGATGGGTKGGSKAAAATGAKASAGTTPPAATPTPETAGAAPSAKAEKGEAAHAQPPAKAPAASEAPAPAPARAPEPQPSKASAAAAQPLAAAPEAPARPRESAPTTPAPPTPAPVGLKATPASSPADAPVVSPADAPSLSPTTRGATIPGPPVEPGGRLSPESPGLKPQRVTAHAGAPDMQPVSVSGPSARGDAMAGGAELGLRLLNEILNHFAGKVQEQHVADALAQIEPRVRSFQERNPHMGVTLIVYYSQWEAPPDSPIRPGPRFERIELGVGQTREEAFENWRDTPALRAALGHRVSESFEQLWVPPTKPLPPKPREAKPLPEPPFPRLSLATFAGEAATLQNVSWDVSFGFDDEGETALAVPEGVVPRFYVLDVPKELKLVAPMKRTVVYERSVPVAERGVEGGSVPALDLDPYVPGGTASAVCVFPADHATAELFGRTPTTYGQGNFIGYRNFGLARWVRPENIRLVR